MSLVFKFIFLLALSANCLILKASSSNISINNIDVLPFNKIRQELILKTSTVFFTDSLKSDAIPVKFKRGKAIIFCVLTGFLGGHRIYLGTHHRTPIIYSATLGGFGILPLVDLIHIIFSKDISKYENKPEIIMWRK